VKCGKKTILLVYLAEMKQSNLSIHVQALLLSNVSPALERFSEMDEGLKVFA